MSKIKIFEGFWDILDVKRYPHALFIYGDNNVKKGAGGQAIIRFEPNTYGIPTKKYPSSHVNSYYTDTEYNDNIKRIQCAIDHIVKISANYKYVVLPENGFGTGLAKLSTKAPKTWQYLLSAVEKMKQLI